MNRLILILVAIFGLTSCFKETAYQSTYILRPKQQMESGGEYTPLEGVKAYAFEGTTEELSIESYDDALVGVATIIDSGEQQGPFVSADVHNGSTTEISMLLDRVESVIVVVDTQNKIYAYTDYEIPVNLSEIYVDITFLSWKESSYTSNKWNFVVPEVEDDLESTQE